MNNQNLITAILVSLGLIIGGYFIGQTHLNAKKFDRYVQVKGLAEREVTADLAVWPIQISLTGNNLENLRSDIERQKNEVFRFFETQGFNSEEISSGITNIQDARADRYNREAQFMKNPYMAVSEFTIRTSDIDKLQNALTESLQLASKGILLGSKNTWEPIEYIYTQLNEIKPSMIEEATKNARKVAAKFAEDSNSKVGKIKSANQGIFSISNRDQNTPQIKKVRVVSTISYFLQD